MAAFALEYSARLALAAGEWDREEHEILHALEILKLTEVPVAAWRVHATAWNVYRLTNAPNGDAERAMARSVILQLAESLREFPSLRKSFLSAEPVRRVLDEETRSSSSVSRSNVSA